MGKRMRGSGEAMIVVSSVGTDSVCGSGTRG